MYRVETRMRKKKVLPHFSMARQKIAIQNQGMQYYYLVVYAQIFSDFFGEWLCRMSALFL
jgi:hypothetical protein